MKRIVIIMAILVSLLLVGCEKPIGGDKDEHGCLTAAGYQWCESRDKCVRAWEEYCEDLKEQFKPELVTDFESCEKAGFPVMESYPRQCMDSLGNNYVENLEDHASLCESKNGLWSDEYDECTSISETDCLEIGGTFIECGSACRHDPDAEVCIQMCVQYCTFN